MKKEIKKVVFCLGNCLILICFVYVVKWVENKFRFVCNLFFCEEVKFVLVVY